MATSFLEKYERRSLEQGSVVLSLGATGMGG